MKLTTYTKIGNKSQTSVVGNQQVFAGKVNQSLLTQAIRVYLSNQRQGSSKVKSRGEIKRTKKKWYKQKGTGNARHGAKSAPIFVGGGVAHGPTGKENWKRRLPQRLKHLAIMSALSLQVDKTMVWNGLDTLTGKTKIAASSLTKLTTKKDKVLIVLAKAKPEIVRALRNLDQVLLTKANQLNVYEVARADKIIFSPQAISVLEDRLLKYIKPIKKQKKSS